MTSIDFTPEQWDYIVQCEQRAYKRGYNCGVNDGRLIQIREELEMASFRRDVPITPANAMQVSH